MDMYIPERQLQPPHSGSHTTEQSNRIQARLEARACTEAETGAPEFVEWLTDYREALDFLPILCALIRGTHDARADAGLAAWRLMQDYQQHRVANVDADELAEIEQQICEEYVE